MCANDTMAISAIREINMRGLKVPDDISIIGFVAHVKGVVNRRHRAPERRTHIRPAGFTDDDLSPICCLDGTAMHNLHIEQSELGRATLPEAVTPAFDCTASQC